MLPDNFFYFIILFSISILGAAHMYYSYHRSRILLANAFMFLLCAIRVSTEYYLPQIEDFTTAYQLATFHSIVAFLIGILLWYCTWFYVRPFKNYKKETLFNRLFVGITMPIFLVRAYGLFNRYEYTLLPEKINGYWVYQTNADTYASMLTIGMTYFFSALTFALFILDIFRTRKEIIAKSFLAISFLILPVILINFVQYQSIQEYRIPNSGFIFFIHTLIISWFFTNYRLFRSDFSEAIEDIIDSVSDLAIFTNTQQVITYANQKAVQQLSIQSKHKESIAQLLAPFNNQTIKEIQEFIAQLIISPQESQEVVLNIDKEIRYFNLKVAPYNKGNQHIGYTFILSDLTSIKKKEEELAALNRSKDQLFAIIGHDLRKPALAFRGISKKINFLLEEKKYKLLNRFGQHIEESAFTLNSLLDNLLNWASSQRGVLPYHPSSIPILEIVEEVIEPFEASLNNKNILIHRNIPKHLFLYIDVHAFMAILRNLLDNAIKFTPPKGTINLSAIKKDNHIHISIQDNGLGINEDKLSQIFSISKEKIRPGTAGEKGSGIGLSLVKSLVEINHGHIQVSSKLGAGTTFRVIFPIHKNKI